MLHGLMMSAEEINSNPYIDTVLCLFCTSESLCKFSNICIHHLWICFRLSLTAFNNEFFNKACEEWRERLSEGWNFFILFYSNGFLKSAVSFRTGTSEEILAPSQLF